LLVVAFYVVDDCWDFAYLWFAIVHKLGAEKFDVGRLGRLTLYDNLGAEKFDVGRLGRLTL
jgi:hypothetical protein